MCVCWRLAIRLQVTWHVLLQSGNIYASHEHMHVAQFSRLPKFVGSPQARGPVTQDCKSLVHLCHSTAAGLPAQVVEAVPHDMPLAISDAAACGSHLEVHEALA